MENGGVGGGHNSHASSPLAASSPNPNEQQEAIALKKALEWELSLDARELRSHAWYHGALPRQRAEEIVQRDGDFLVRDCASQPDNYVLTCRSKSQVLHFVLNKVSRGRGSPEAVLTTWFLLDFSWCCNRRLCTSVYSISSRKMPSTLCPI